MLLYCLWKKSFMKVFLSLSFPPLALPYSLSQLQPNSLELNLSEPSFFYDSVSSPASWLALEANPAPF